jgi:TolA-binding protein
VENDAPVAPQPGRDRELSRFRAAHDLHFAGDRPREAIQAYAEYLREYPNGRFVPEARYNGALDQIKLGNEAAARKALAPFAAGRLGGYRQKEARELLEALDRQASSSKR